MTDSVGITRNRCDGTDIMNNQPVCAVKISPSFTPFFPPLFSYAFVSRFASICVKSHGRIVPGDPKEALE